MGGWPAIITAIVTIISTILAVLGGAFGLGWCVRSWIDDLNGKREISFQGLKDEMHAMLTARDAKDQARHVENLGRFSAINVRLARMGNGSHGGGS